jgi:Zn-dependent peptidase ImmA (M78 family)
MERVDVEPRVLRWARERAGRSVDSLRNRFPRLELWERREARPTLRQLESFAKATHTPIGYLFLPEPPEERVPIPDLRTVRNERIEQPSPDLLDTLYMCQQRQEWYRDHARSVGDRPLEVVGSVTLESDVVTTAADMRHALGFDLEERRRIKTWTEALRRFIGQADALGILVMVSGVVGNNTHRRLDPDEFRGFALVDPLAPVVFVNGADTKAAQMFTLAHELAHVWLGRSALSDAQAGLVPDQAGLPEQQVERWCNRVAAELLVPLAAVREEYEPANDLREEMTRLARRFKVSTLVILRRIHDAGGLTRDELWATYREELDRLMALPRGEGGHFYLTEAVRVSRRFARALVGSTLEGQTLHRDAFRMLGVSKLETFRRLGRSLGVG